MSENRAGTHNAPAPRTRDRDRNRLTHSRASRPATAKTAVHSSTRRHVGAASADTDDDEDACTTLGRVLSEQPLQLSQENSDNAYESSRQPAAPARLRPLPLATCANNSTSNAGGDSPTGIAVARAISTGGTDRERGTNSDSDSDSDSVTAAFFAPSRGSVFDSDAADEAAMPLAVLRLRPAAAASARWTAPFSPIRSPPQLSGLAHSHSYTHGTHGNSSHGQTHSHSRAHSAARPARSGGGGGGGGGGSQLSPPPITSPLRLSSAPRYSDNAAGDGLDDRLIASDRAGSDRGGPLLSPPRAQCTVLSPVDVALLHDPHAGGPTVFGAALSAAAALTAAGRVYSAHTARARAAARAFSPDGAAAALSRSRSRHSSASASSSSSSSSSESARAAADWGPLRASAATGVEPRRARTTVGQLSLLTALETGLSPALARPPVAPVQAHPFEPLTRATLGAPPLAAANLGGFGQTHTGGGGFRGALGRVVLQADSHIGATDVPASVGFNSGVAAAAAGSVAAAAVGAYAHAVAEEAMEEDTEAAGRAARLHGSSSAALLQPAPLLISTAAAAAAMAAGERAPEAPAAAAARVLAAAAALAPRGGDALWGTLTAAASANNAAHGYRHGHARSGGAPLVDAVRSAEAAGGAVRAALVERTARVADVAHSANDASQSASSAATQSATDTAQSAIGAAQSAIGAAQSAGGAAQGAGSVLRQPTAEPRLSGLRVDTGAGADSTAATATGAAAAATTSGQMQGFLSPTGTGALPQQFLSPQPQPRRAGLVQLMQSPTPQPQPQRLLSPGALRPALAPSVCSVGVGSPGPGNGPGSNSMQSPPSHAHMLGQQQLARARFTQPMSPQSPQLRSPPLLSPQSNSAVNIGAAACGTVTGAAEPALRRPQSRASLQSATSGASTSARAPALLSPTLLSPAPLSPLPLGSARSGLATMVATRNWGRSPPPLQPLPRTATAASSTGATAAAASTASQSQQQTRPRSTEPATVGIDPHTADTGQRVLLMSTLLEPRSAYAVTAALSGQSVIITGGSGTCTSSGSGGSIGHRAGDPALYTPAGLELAAAAARGATAPVPVPCARGGWDVLEASAAHAVRAEALHGTLVQAAAFSAGGDDAAVDVADTPAARAAFGSAAAQVASAAAAATAAAVAGEGIRQVAASRVVVAPALSDDFYLSLLAFAPDASGRLAVGLGNAVAVTRPGAGAGDDADAAEDDADCDPSAASVLPGARTVLDLARGVPAVSSAVLAAVTALAREKASAAEARLAAARAKHSRLTQQRPQQQSQTSASLTHTQTPAWAQAKANKKEDATWDAGRAAQLSPRDLFVSASSLRRTNTASSSATAPNAQTNAGASDAGSSPRSADSSMSVSAARGAVARSPMPRRHASPAALLPTSPPPPAVTISVTAPTALEQHPNANALPPQEIPLALRGKPTSRVAAVAWRPWGAAAGFAWAAGSGLSPRSPAGAGACCAARQRDVRAPAVGRAAAAAWGDTTLNLWGAVAQSWEHRAALADTETAALMARMRGLNINSGDELESPVDMALPVCDATAADSNLPGTSEAARLARRALDEPESQLAVSTTDGSVLLVDAATGALVRSFAGHRSGHRIGALSWGAPTLLASGGRDRYVVLHDTRAPQAVAWLAGHSQEICGLDFARGGGGDGAPWMLASGGNDNKVCVWNIRMLSSASAPPVSANSSSVSGTNSGSVGGGQYSGTWNVATAPMCTLRGHRAAVKAVAWSPHVPGLLATGGGTADRCIRLWDVFADDGSGAATIGTGASGALGAGAVAVVDTGSQVCQLAWSPSRRGELFSSHGYARHHIALWRAPELAPLALLQGHGARVLHLALRPDGALLASAAGGADGTLRYWPVGPPPDASGGRGTLSGGILR